MNEQKIEFKVQPNESNDPVTIVLREGSAQRIQEPVLLNLENVCIISLAEYIAARNWPESKAENKALIIYSDDPDSAWIELREDPNHPLGTVITAQLLDNPDFKAFGINKGKQFSQKQLELFVREKAHCFDSVDDARKLIDSLRNFEVRYEQTVKKEDDRQGNKENSHKEAIKFAKGELPKALNLRMPLFKNQKPITFTIEVEVDKQSNNLPGFSFYSLDVELQRRQMAEEIILSAVDVMKKTHICLRDQQ